jgi:hypothetical protein
MSALLEEIGALIDAPSVDREHVERTLTDGYAHVLSLEAERWRLQRRVEEIAHGLRPDDAAAPTIELRALARRLDGSADELSRLRARLAELRSRVSR